MLATSGLFLLMSMGGKSFRTVFAVIGNVATIQKLLRTDENSEFVEFEKSRVKSVKQCG